MFQLLSMINSKLGANPKVLQFLKYKNEFDTMQKIDGMNLGLQKQFWKLYPEEECNMSKMKKESERLRAEGNKLFTAKDKTRDVLGACGLYTKAIFAAPFASQELALAFANRAIALLDFGYVQQAYDDCVCALEHGYPENLKHKVIMRQAECARKLGDVVLLRKHLDALEKMSLNDVFIKQADVLSKTLNMLSLDESDKPKNKEKADLSLNRDSQKIVHSSAGSYMVASRAIQPDELIYREKAFGFVPVDDFQVCQACTATQLIPIPCMRCFGRVVYCSLKCRTAHDAIHGLECAAYRRKIFPFIKFSEIQLALRMVITGLPQVVPLLCHETNGSAIWAALVGQIALNESLDYAASLRMVSIYGAQAEEYIIPSAMSVYLLTAYLKRCTNFFNFAKSTAAPQSDWELVAAALMLRHFGQSRSKRSYASIVLSESPCLDPLILCRNSLWAGPLRVQRGHLHSFSATRNITIANFPYTSFNLHACQPSFDSQFSGGYISTFAKKNIKAREKIYACYTSDHRHSSYAQRRVYLQSAFKLNCKCVKCNCSDPDKDFAQFHRYRCENSGCRRVFTMMPNNSVISWWIDGNYKKFTCKVCGAVQTCEWYHKFSKLLDNCHEPSVRSLLFKKFDALDNWVLDYHEVKMFLAMLLATNCFAMHFFGKEFLFSAAGIPLTDAEFAKLVKIVKFMLEGTAAQEGEKSLEYAARMTFLWDLIAFGKYKCSKNEMQKMLQCVELVSDEFKKIFMNYYEDYVKPML